MEKVKLEFTAPKNKKVSYNDCVIDVVSYISFAQQFALINKYIADYFEKDKFEFNYIDAEYKLSMYILSFFTNIDIENFDQEILDGTTIYKEIVDSISNYKEFRERLDVVVNDKKEEIRNKKMLGAVIEDISDKVFYLLENVSKISPESVELTAKRTEDLIKQFSEIKFPSYEPEEEKKKPTRKKKEIQEWLPED